MLLKDYKLISSIFLFTLSFGSTDAQVVAPVFDTATKTYQLYDIKNDKINTEAYNILDYYFSNNELILHLRNNYQSVFINNYGKILYRGQAFVDRFLISNKGTSYLITKKDNKNGLIQAKIRKSILPALYEFISNIGNKLFFYDEKAKSILIFDMNSMRSMTIRLQGIPNDISKLNDENHNFFYYTTDSGSKGLFDLNRGEILFGEYSYFLQINPEMFVCKKNNRLVLFDLTNKSTKEFEGEDIYRISSDRIVLNYVTHSILLNNQLRSVDFQCNAKYINFITTDSLYGQLKNKWYIFDGKGNQIDTAYFDDILQIKGTIWGVRKKDSKLISLGPGSINHIELRGDRLFDFQPLSNRLVVQYGENYFLYKILNNSAVLISESNLPILLTDSAQIIIYGRGKYGLRTVSGKLITDSKYDIIIPLSAQYLLVSWNNNYRYLMNYSGYEFIK